MAEEATILLHDGTGVIEEFANGSTKHYHTTISGCNCNYRFNHGMIMCKHIIHLRKASGLPIFDKSVYGREYIDEFMTVDFTMPVLDELAVENHFEQLEYEEMEQDLQVNAVKSKSSRYLQLKEQTDVIAELAAAAPASLHVDLLDLLSKLASHIRASEIPNLILPNSFPTPLTPTSDLESDSANVVVDVIDSDERVVFDEVADDEVVDVASNKSLSPILSLKFSVDDDQKSYITGNGMIDTGTVDNFVVLLLKTHQFQYQTCALSQPGAVFRPIDKSLPNYQILHLHTRSHFVLTTQQVDGTVFIYDSLPRDSSSIDSNCELYCKITRLYPDFSHLVLYCPQRQEGYVDCGIFCLANLCLNSLGQRSTCY